MKINPEVGKKTQFSKENQPENRGRPKGYLNAKTILEKFLTVELDQENPFSGEIEKMSVAELMHLKQIASALEGDLQAYKEIISRIEGDNKQSVEVSTKTPINLKELFGFESDNP